MAKKRKKLKKSASGFFIILLLLAAVAAVLLAAPSFNITSIDVYGVSKLSEQEVVLASGIKQGNNVFRTSLRKAKKSIEAMPYIENARLIRKFPARIEIKVNESVLAARVVYGDEFIGLDKNGKVLDKSADNSEGVMLIEGVIPVKTDEGQLIEYESADFFKVQTDIFEQLQKNRLFGIVKALNLENRSYICLTTTEGLDIYIGNTDELDYKFKLLASIREQGYTSGVFDITNTSQPTFRKNK